MNDEIKEMLELHIKHEIDLLPKNQQEVLDYITNLQQELKYQEEAEIEYNEKHTKLMKEYKRLKEEIYHIYNYAGLETKDLENKIKKLEESK